MDNKLPTRFDDDYTSLGDYKHDAPLIRLGCF